MVCFCVSSHCSWMHHAQCRASLSALVLLLSWLLHLFCWRRSLCRLWHVDIQIVLLWSSFECAQISAATIKNIGSGLRIFWKSTKSPQMPSIIINVEMYLYTFAAATTCMIWFEHYFSFYEPHAKDCRDLCTKLTSLFQTFCCVTLYQIINLPQEEPQATSVKADHSDHWPLGAWTAGKPRSEANVPDDPHRLLFRSCERWWSGWLKTSNSQRAGVCRGEEPLSPDSTPPSDG